MRRAARQIVRIALTGLAVLVACGPRGRPAQAYVTPPPGGALAWGAGGALLADPEGALAAFDDPARLADSSGARGFEIAASRARLDELDALTRVRAGFRARRGSLAAALGVETFGPPAWRAERLVLAVARTAGGTALGAAWSERRVAGPDGAAARGRTLDVAAAARLPAFAGGLSVLGCARSVAAFGDPAALADPDWTAELALELGAARAHLTRTRDLSGARSGAGVALAAGGLRVVAGAVGPPVQWSLGVSVSRAPGHGPRAAFGRVVHPVLGASDALEGSAAW